MWNRLIEYIEICWWSNNILGYEYDTTVHIMLTVTKAWLKYKYY